jgi:hypothetical protein
VNENGEGRSPRMSLIRQGELIMGIKPKKEKKEKKKGKDPSVKSLKGEDESTQVVVPKNAAPAEKKGLTDDDKAEGTSVNMASSSSITLDVKPIAELVKPEIGMIRSPFGPAYWTRRSRPYPDDEWQMLYETWRFDCRGYFSFGSPETGYDVRNYNAIQSQLNKTYAYLRQIMKMERKPRLKSDTLTDERMADYFNVYHNAVANLVMPMAFNKLYHYNEYFQTNSTYLPDAMVRVSRLWDELKPVIVPDWLKALSIRDGYIAASRQFPVPHLRIWALDNLTLYGVSGAYDSSYLIEATKASFPLDSLWSSAADIDSFLDDIQSMIEVLHGLVGNGTTQRDEVLSLIEVMQYCATVEKLVPAYSQGLPSLEEIPGLVNSPSIMSEWYARWRGVEDTHGASTNEVNSFPITQVPGLSPLVPVKGWGQQSILDFTLMGAAKFASKCIADGYPRMDVPYVGRVNGMSIPCVCPSGTLDPISIGCGYTREDGFLDLNFTQDNAADMVAAVRAGHYILRHVYWPTLTYASQDDTNIEFRTLDMVPVDYEMWVEPDHYPEFTANWIAKQMGVPYMS